MYRVVTVCNESTPRVWLGGQDLLPVGDDEALVIGKGREISRPLLPRTS
jgi:hypothetical protein